MFRTSGGEEFFLQTRTPHRHTRKSPIGPPYREGLIVEVSQRCQTSNYGLYLSGRRCLRREQLFNLSRRAITARQRTRRHLQPLIEGRYRLVCDSPTHRL
jgi:hypothetical protein